MSGQTFHDLEWEKRVQIICQESQIGAQFGGKYLTHDVHYSFTYVMRLLVRWEWGVSVRQIEISKEKSRKMVFS